MTDWRERANEAIAHNIADVFEHGPRLATTRKTAALAIDRANNRVLKTGLGAMGVGTMWCRYSEEEPDWADVPEASSIGGQVGEACQHPETDRFDHTRPTDSVRWVGCTICWASWNEPRDQAT